MAQKIKVIIKRPDEQYEKWRREKEARGVKD